MYPNQPPNPYQPPQAQYPQAQYPQQGYPPPQTSGYEFTADENKQFTAAGLWLRVVGVVSFMSGLGQAYGKNHSYVAAGVDIFIAVLLFTAAQAFKRIVDTQGDDVPQLMKALDALGNVLLIRIISSIFLLVVVIIACAAVLALAAAFSK